MEELRMLEEKISSLIAIAQSLKEENAKLVEEKIQLAHKLSSMESSLVKDDEDRERLYREKKLTKTVVDNLIKSIDLLVKNEQQQ